ncbi:SICAvar, type I (fragment) [Plasmodium knowlesi strain H]|uniref:SICAvar, type I n=1 Tax=Plasmodium knowlesi (strain H) TaxID=5851 RepID=A0A1A7VP82_PLAKH
MAERFSKLLAEWYKDAGKSGDAYATLQDELKKMFEELGKRIESPPDPPGVAKACGDVTVKYEAGGEKQDKKICKTLLKTIYWMNGIDENGKPEVDGSPPEERYLKQHLRCIVGYSAMVEIMKVKCDVKDVMKAVQSAVEEKIKVGGNELLNNKCGPIKLEDMKFSAQILGKTLGEWVRQMNGLKEDILKQVLQKAQSCSSGAQNGKMEDCLKEKLELGVGECIKYIK